MDRNGRHFRRFRLPAHHGGEYSGGSEVFKDHGRSGICYNRQQRALRVFSSPGLGDESLRESPLHAGGGKDLRRYGLLRQPSDRNAGTLCGRLKCCNDESGPCEVDGDEGVREGGRIRGKGQCGEKSRCRSCRDRKTGGRRNLIRRRNCLSGGAFCSWKVS